LRQTEYEIQKRKEELNSLKEKVCLLETKLEHKNKMINELLDRDFHDNYLYQNEEKLVAADNPVGHGLTF